MAKKVESLLEALKPITERKNMFVELFSESKKKPKGPIWHLWHFCLALMPSLFVTVVCLNVKPIDAATQQARLDGIRDGKAGKSAKD